MAFSTDTRQFSDAVQHAVDITNGITPSVLALARASGVTANKFAKALAEAEANSLYRIEVSSVLQKMLVDSAVDEAKKKAKKGEAGDTG